MGGVKIRSNSSAELNHLGFGREPHGPAVIEPGAEIKGLKPADSISA